MPTKRDNLFTRVLKGYFDTIYTVAGRERRIAQRTAIEHGPGALLLDCGCREGDGTLRAADSAQTNRLIGLDYNAQALRLAARRGIWALQADLNRAIPLSENSVDAILASDVLEHLVEPAVFVREIYRVLRPGGYVVLDTPNLASWHNVFALLIGVQPFSGSNITTMEDSDVGIVRQMHRSTHGLADEGEYLDHGEHELTRHIVVVAFVSLVRLFQRTGFEIKLARGFGYYPLPGWLARACARLDPRHTHHVLIKARKPLV